jgi:hypothetical protein
MGKEHAQLTPEHRFWHEDLPLRESPVEGEVRQFEDVSAIGAEVLQISRTDNFMRGVGFLGFLLCAPIALFITSLLIEHLPKMIVATPVITVLFIPVLLLVYSVLWALLKLDFQTPRDHPVRFNRKTRKVQALEWGLIWWNPFAKWPITYKEFDWDHVQAEIHKQAGTNGKAYVVRYSMDLCLCKPGTLEVVDRLTLKGNRNGTVDFYWLWNFVRVYMEQGPEALPKTRLLPEGISFRRSFFEYMRFLDPTEDGRAVRKAVHALWIPFNVVLSLLLFPLLALAGIGHYIAMRVAPEPVWPDQMPPTRSAQPRRPGV